jgi:hypothetical protein
LGRESKLQGIKGQEIIAAVSPEIAAESDVIEAIYTCCEETAKSKGDANWVDRDDSSIVKA